MRWGCARSRRDAGESAGDIAQRGYIRAVDDRRGLPALGRRRLRLRSARLPSLRLHVHGIFLRKFINSR
jgi:hypothetical protein